MRVCLFCNFSFKFGYYWSCNRSNDEKNDAIYVNERSFGRQELFHKHTVPKLSLLSLHNVRTTNPASVPRHGCLRYFCFGSQIFRMYSFFCSFLPSVNVIVWKLSSIADIFRFTITTNFVSFITRVFVIVRKKKRKRNFIVVFCFQRKLITLSFKTIFCRQIKCISWLH